MAWRRVWECWVHEARGWHSPEEVPGERERKKGSKGKSEGGGKVKKRKKIWFGPLEAVSVVPPP
ncbi:hypothetical protein E2C01_043551 [Portunus trituberculatus]|uniref:Uncharacterized protein n=1 Tax=Portunus trituberculatus TaxID=210409 RepID=A0A5B7FX07_PORTR|nr:hypothetical protein [Portunus trituberculatus]